MMSITASGVWRIASLRRLIKEKLPTEFVLQEVLRIADWGCSGANIWEAIFHQGRHDLLVI
jgi:hypothetical protein